jgi:hypothetical protein
MTLLLPILAWAQSNSGAGGQGSGVRAEAVRKLDDGSYVVRITDGDQSFETRALPAPMIREFLNQKAQCDRTVQERDLLDKERTQLKTALDLALKDREIAFLTVKNVELERDKYKSMFELADRLARKGRVTTFFENPFVQIATKIGWQGVQTWLGARR